MKTNFTILVNEKTKKIIVLNNQVVRYTRLRRRIHAWVNNLSIKQSFQFVMCTLTYSPEFQWDANHIREFMLKERRLLGKGLLAYAWVAELQHRGAVHYHVMFVVPSSVVVGSLDMPYPDLACLWPYGMSRMEVARSPFYLVKYLGKEYQKDYSKMPKGIRVFGLFIGDRVQALLLRYCRLTDWERVIIDEMGWGALRQARVEHRFLQAASGLGVWELLSLERDVGAAVQQAVWCEQAGYEWSGRELFVEAKEAL